MNLPVLLENNAQDNDAKKGNDGFISSACKVAEEGASFTPELNHQILFEEEVLFHVSGNNSYVIEENVIIENLVEDDLHTNVFNGLGLAVDQNNDPEGDLQPGVLHAIDHTIGTKHGISHSTSDTEDERDLDYVPSEDENHAVDSEELMIPESNISVKRKIGKDASQTTLELKKKRKTDKNSGRSYQTKSGKLKPSRAVQELEPCRMKCKEKLTEQERKQLFAEYWELGQYDRRVAFIASKIEIQRKALEKRKQSDKKAKNREFTYLYHFNVNGIEVPVCKGCFLKTLNETPKFIEIVMKKKVKSVSGTTGTDERGKHAPSNKIEEERLQKVNDHINLFPAYTSHYTRKHTSKKYLGSDLNLTIMYNLYSEQEQNPVSKPIYTKQFHKTGLKFKRPALDTCTTCDTLNSSIKNANADERSILETQLREHQEAADRAYASKKFDIQLSKSQPNLLVFTFDLQQVLPTPRLTSGNVFYKRQLNTYNLTIHNCTDGSSNHFMWHEAIGKRGSVEIASCLYKFLQSVPSQISHVIFYSDTCGGQNKNSTVISMFTYAMQNHPSLGTLEHKFLIPGHTHMECDADHAAIERKAKKSNMKIQHPRDWYQLVRMSGKKNLFNVVVMEREWFLDFTSLVGRKGPLGKKKVDNHGNKFDYRQLKWVKFDQQFGCIAYKTTLDKEIQFKFMDLKKKTHENFVLEQAYERPLPINIKKKENLLSLLGQIDLDVHNFYETLSTKDMRDEDPDLDRLNSDNEDL